MWNLNPEAVLKLLIILFGIGYLLYWTGKVAVQFFIGYHSKDFSAGRRKEDIRIDYVPPKKRSFDGGEYVDYEEVE
ncbi:MAG: hypothetical protein KatS3mg033_1904 [Thermonema sp.]|nr:MAG: hypothetical protein KatS3mg033_1904 [Thermonema sp.]